ncbi:MAG: multidrug effflux MFS transporter [Gammaproteobacteria bacterium]|nr:multidrug effflux MFS transporter [Gammaproteobacteria bacterium]MDE0248268.1 multidrug effflux MFS transporter [Gammaproteobacteria bacterium]
MSRQAAGALLHPREFVPLAALLMSLSALSIDAMLPALPAIGRDFQVSRSNDLQFVVGAIFLGLGLGQIAIGPLSDRIGRKSAMHAGLAVFIAGCLVSIFASTFGVMIAGRILQGIGVSGPRIVTIAVVRDQYRGREMARLMSFVMAVFILVPTFAPALGQGIEWLGGWRAIFATFVAIAAAGSAWFAFRQPETLPASRRRPFSPRAVGGTVLEILRIRPALGYTLARAFAFAPFLAYITSAQQIFQVGYRTGALFPLWFAVAAVAVGFSLLVNGRLVMRYGMRRLAKGAAAVIALVSVPAWGLALAFGGLPPFWLFMVYLVVVFSCVGLLFGNLGALAMEPLGHVAGAGAAVIGSVSIFVALPLGTLVGQSFDGTMVAQIAAFGVFGGAAFAAIQWAAGSPGSRAFP